MDQTALSIALIGAPVEAGASQPGCIMGPAAMRTAGIGRALEDLGHQVRDLGDTAPDSITAGETLEGARNFTEVAGHVRALERQSYAAASQGAIPIFMGGDHSLSMGSVAGVARHARETGRELFVLWLDAHADFNTVATSPTGNMHGMSVAALCGLPGLEAIYGRDADRLVDPRSVHMLGIRSVDPLERAALTAHHVNVADMRAVDEFGLARLTRRVIEAVKARNGMLHVSLDVDFLDPDVAPAVGTTVPGGATVREAHLVMELLHESGTVASLDLVELNPFLDERGRTARLMVDLTASLFGRQVMDRPTRSQWSD
ncbi:MAG TPA: arginase [Devosiaceae bacterium]